MPDNNQPRDVFISYSRKNKADVLPIKGEIERLGLTCWIDLSDIPSGENFKGKVIPGIRQTRVAFLFFLSTESQSSEYAMKEINFAKKRAKKRVILVRFNDDEMTDDFFFDYQDADIIDWRVPEQKEKLLRDLREWSKGEVAADVIKPQDGTTCSRADQNNHSSKSSSAASAQRSLQSSSTTKRTNSRPKKKRKLPISISHEEISGPGHYALNVENRRREPIDITISVRNGGRHTEIQEIIPGNTIFSFGEGTRGKMAGWVQKLWGVWRFTYGDHGTIKVVGWAAALKFKIDQEGYLIYQ